MTGKTNRFGHPNYRMYVHRHNGYMGRVCHSYHFLKGLLDCESMTEDAKHHVREALTHLARAEEEIRMRRVEPDGSITEVHKKVEAGIYEAVRK